MNEPVFEVDLEDQLLEGAPKLRTKVRVTKMGITVAFEGYGDHCTLPGHGEPVLVELADGSPRVVVWGDINQEDPTDIVPLDGALEILREED